MKESAIRNLTLAGAFWVGVTLLISGANAQTATSSQGAETQAVTTSPSMSIDTVPQTKEDASAAEGSTVIQKNVEVNKSVEVNNNEIAPAPAAPKAPEKQEKAEDKALDSVSKTRHETESANNALLLQQMELDRLKAEQKRIDAIQKFGNDIQQSAASSAPAAPVAAAPAPCGVGPCLPGAQAAPAQQVVEPVVAQNSASSAAPMAAVSTEDHGKSDWSFENAKWGISPIVGKEWSANEGYYGMQNIYTVGVGLEAAIHRWVSVDASFLYGFDQTRPDWIFGRQSRNDYTFQVGAKIGPNYLQTIRPYAYIGGGYKYQNYQLNSWYAVNNYNYNYGRPQSYTDSAFVDTGLGLDIKLDKTFSVGARMDYQYVTSLSSGQCNLNRDFGDQSNRFRLGATALWTF